MSDPLAQVLDLPIEYPVSELGNPHQTIFRIDEIDGKVVLGVNSDWDGYKILSQVLDYLSEALAITGLFPETEQFSIQELFGKIVVDLKEVGIDMVLAWPGLALVTVLVFKLKNRIYEMFVGKTPLPSNIEMKRQSSGK